MLVLWGLLVRRHLLLVLSRRGAEGVGVRWCWDLGGGEFSGWRRVRSHRGMGLSLFLGGLVVLAVAG